MVGYCRLVCIGLCESQSIVILFSLSIFLLDELIYFHGFSNLLGGGGGNGVGIISKATSSGYNFMLSSKYGFYLCTRKHLSKPDFLRNTQFYFKHLIFPVDHAVC